MPTIDPRQEIRASLEVTASAIGDRLTEVAPDCGITKIRPLANGGWDPYSVFRLLADEKFMEHPNGSRRNLWTEVWDRFAWRALPGSPVAGERPDNWQRELEWMRAWPVIRNVIWSLVRWRNMAAHTAPLDQTHAIRALADSADVLHVFQLDEQEAAFRKHLQSVVIACADALHKSTRIAPIRMAGPPSASTASVAITWANQTGGDDWLTDLWCAVATDGDIHFTRAAPDEVVAMIISLADSGRPVTVGAAFALGIPKAFLNTDKKRGRPPFRAQDIWEALAENEGAHGTVRDRLAAAPPPFWGVGYPCASPPKGATETNVYRTTEARIADALTPPRSALQLTGLGNVGSLSVAGLPIIARLYENRFRVWPFHDPPGDLRIVELFPRALLTHLLQPSPDEDARAAFLAGPEGRALGLGRDAEKTLLESVRAFDAVFCAWALARYGEPLPDTSENPDARIEGEIWLPR